MDPEQAVKELEKGTVRPLYILYGSEYFYVREILSALRQQVLSDGDAAMNLSEYSGKDAPVVKVLDDLRTMTFFGGMRLVIVEDADNFITQNKDALENYAAAPSKSGCLVLICSNKPDGRTNLVQKNKQALIPCETPKGGRLYGWVRSRIKELGKNISSSAARLLVDIVGSDLAQLESHIQMLITYVGGNKTITDADVAATVEEEKTIQIWDLMDGIAIKNGKMALEALDCLLPKTGMETARLTLIATTLLNLARVKRLVEQNISESEISKLLKMHPYVAKKNVENARKFSSLELAAGIHKTLETDIAIKSSRITPRLAVEKLIVDLCK